MTEPISPEPTTNAPAEPAATEPTTEPTGAEPEPQEDHAAEAAKWKALARKHEAAAKANATAAQKLAEIEDAKKTAEQKLQDQLTEAHAKLAAFEVGDIRRGAAAEAGLPPELSEFITASDPEEALAQAKRLAERVKPPEPPVAGFAQGSRTTAKPAQNIDDWIRGFARGN